MALSALKKTRPSAAILESFRRGHAKDHAKDINLTLRPAYRDLLEKLGSPNQKLPPVFHVAGTNGKGSTCAFLRAFLESAGYKVHVYTSPHLVHFHERIRIAGECIGEEELVDILTECEKISSPGAISYFEAATAAAFTAFARHPADFAILETGLGGRLDATNIVETPLATIITRLSMDHREYLGESLAKIAYEKAGIMRPGVPCFAAKGEGESIKALGDAAAKIGAPLFLEDRDWQITPQEKGFKFKHNKCEMDLPFPALIGKHQLQNAGLALAALSGAPKRVPPQSLALGLQKVEWPARLEQLKTGPLVALAGKGRELWLDGGHNDSAGEVLAEQMRVWQGAGGVSLHLILGMLMTKNPQDFLEPLAPYIASLHTVAIPDEPQSFSADELAARVRAMGISNVTVSSHVGEAIEGAAKKSITSKILICGSLYLAGHVLKENGA